MFLKISLDLDAALAEAHVEFEEAEREMRGIQISNATLNDSGCDLAVSTSQEGDVKPRLSNGAASVSNEEKAVKNDDVQPIFGDQGPQHKALLRNKKKENGVHSSQRSKQRPRTTPAIYQHLPKHDRLPVSGHVSSIVGRFEQARPEDSSSAETSSYKRKSVGQLPPSASSTQKISLIRGSKSLVA